MMNFQSNAILAKTRAIYGKHITQDQYHELVKKKSIKDAVMYLRNETSYHSILENIKDDDIHRGRIEPLLHEEGYCNLKRIMRYTNSKDRTFYELGNLYYEHHILLHKVSSLLNDTEFSLNRDIYSKTHIINILDCESLSELVDIYKKTSYEKPLVLLENKHITFNEFVLELKKIRYKRSYEAINTYKGQIKKDLLLIFNTSVELENMTKIYRLKKFFNATPEEIEKTLILDYTRIPKSFMNKLIHTKSSEEFIELLQSSIYHLYIDDKDYIFIEYYTKNIQYYLVKRYIRFSKYPEVVYYAYSILQNIQIDNLKTIIEGLRYNQTQEAIEKGLIY